MEALFEDPETAAVGLGSVVRMPGGTVGRVVALAAPQGRRRGIWWLVKVTAGQKGSGTLVEVRSSLLAALS